MRYLKRQVINRRDPADKRLAVDINNSVLMTTPTGVQVPAGTTSQRPVRGQRYGTSNPNDLSGFIRYNTSLDQIEGYQAGEWRAMRFKESIGIIQQLLGVSNGSNTVFGPLNVPIPATVDVNVDGWTQYGNLTTPGTSWTGANIIVIVGGIFQMFNTNYTIMEGSTIPIVAGTSPGPYTTGQNYVVFSSPVPGSPVTLSGNEVYALYGFDR